MIETIGPTAMSSSVHDPRYLELISRLRGFRRTAGISQLALAESLGRVQSYVSKVESGERRIDVIELSDICHALDISLLDVLPPQLREQMK